jgi:DNA-binding transcriptional LysR family regulator
METNRLKQFCVVTETGNLRKAATLLGISHSGLSKSMKALEQELGFSLFQPSGRGIVVSDQGLKLYTRSKPFFSELDRLLGTVSSSNPVRIGSFEVFTSFFMGKLLSKHIAELKLAEFEMQVHELVPGRLEEALILNKVDIGITYEPIPRPGIDYVRVKSLHMGAFVRQGTFEGRAWKSIPFVAPVSPLEGTPSGVKGRDGWPDEKFKRNIVYRVDLMATGLELTRQGLCAIFIPEFVARLYNETVLERFKLEPIELPKGMSTVKRDVYIVKRESTIEDTVIRKVAQAIREII